MRVRNAACLGSLLLLAACGPNGCSGDNSQERVFNSLAECQKDPTYTAQQCLDAFARASQEQAASAPRYSNRDSCEELYGPGNCVPRGSGDSSFIPMMTGFMLGNMMSGGGGTTYISRPVYIDRGGTAYTTGGRSIGTVTPGRGGFGGSASSWSGFHSSSSSPGITSGGSVSRGGFGGSAFSASSSGGE